MVALPSPDYLDRQDVSALNNRRSAELGDGFRRYARGGLNASTERIQVRWTRFDTATAIGIYNTIKNTDAVDAIEFTPLDEGVERSFTLVPGTLTRSPDNNLVTVVQCTLEERFLP